MAINATKRPEELMEGRIFSAPASAPLGSVETRIVEALQEESACTHVSRKYIWRPGGTFSAKLAASELKAM